MVVRRMIFDYFDSDKLISILLETLYDLPERPLSEQVPNNKPAASAAGLVAAQPKTAPAAARKGT